MSLSDKSTVVEIKNNELYGSYRVLLFGDVREAVEEFRRRLAIRVCINPSCPADEIKNRQLESIIYDLEEIFGEKLC